MWDTSLRVGMAGILVAAATTAGGCAPRYRYLPEHPLAAPPESGYPVGLARPEVVPPPPERGGRAGLFRRSPGPPPEVVASASTRSAHVKYGGPPESTYPAGSPHAVPRELTKVTHPEYVIEPPDILLINAPKVVPLPPYKFEPMDTVVISAKAPLPNDPLAGEFVIEPDGRVNLGPKYGTVPITGMTADEARAAVERQLKELLADPTVYLAPSRTRVPQQIVGEHLVRADGKVGLGSYGFVRVTGLTVTQAKRAIEEHLSQFLQTPEVSVDVAAFNSKIIYVIYDGGGAGQTVTRLPVTGNETVLDAVAQLGGLSAVSSQRRIWVARPAPSPAKGVQVLPVDWIGITTEARTDTNYQLFPGDRLFVQSFPAVQANTAISRVLAPFERVLGFSLLGAGVYRNFSNLNAPFGVGF